MKNTVSKNIFLLMTIMLSVILSVNGQENKEIHHYGNPKSSVYDISFLKEGSIIVAAESNVVRFYNTNSETLVKELKGQHNDVILTIDISPDNSLLASAGRDGIIVLWDINNENKFQRLDYHEGVITSVKFSPDSKYIISGSSDKHIVLYDIISKKIVFKINAHNDDITSVAYSPYENIMASTSIDKTIKLWDTKTGKLVSSIANFKNCSRNISFNSDGSRLYSCGDDSKITIWNVHDLTNIKKIQEIKYRGDWLLSIDIHEKDKAFALGGVDGKIKVESGFGKYVYKLGTPITKILFKPNEGNILKVAVATMGKGVMLIPVKFMQAD